jgi:hypothetical protein
MCKTTLKTIMIRITEWCIEAMGWLRIALSPIFMGAIVAAICYYMLPAGFNLFAATLSALLGLYFGIRWASSKWNTGTINFLSGVKEAAQEEHEF